MFAQLAAALPSIIGTKQIGGMAPPTQLGSYQDPFNLPKKDDNAVGDAVAKVLQNSSTMPSAPVGGWQDVDNLPGEPNAFKGFLGGIDKGLQSPSQLLGLGLLSQLTGGHPAAGIAGLLGMGLLNK